MDPIKKEGKEEIDPTKDEEVKIEPYPDDPRYLIYSDGRVYSKITKRFLKPSNSNGYHSVSLDKKIRIQRLIGKTFVNNPDVIRKTHVNHIDEDKKNNDQSNLNWLTPGENNHHSAGSRSPTHGREVLQFDETGTNMIKEYISISEASRMSGISYYKISNSCSLNEKDIKKVITDKKGNNYTWKYKEKEIECPEGKTIPDFPGYIVTKEGKIYIIKSKFYLRTSKTADGYELATLHNEKGPDTQRVNKLVATLFIPMPPELDPKDKTIDAHHINSIRDDNRVENLKWVTRKEHIRLTYESGGLAKRKKKVLQIDVDTLEVIKEFGSIKEASVAIGIGAGAISQVCNGKKYFKTAGGYIWKFKDAKK